MPTMNIIQAVNDALRLRNAYVLVAHRILRQQINGHTPLADSDRKELAEIGIMLEKKALGEIAGACMLHVYRWTRIGV